MITVHHLNNSRSQRVLWLLEELGCEYQVVKYQRDPHTLLAPPELRSIHPLGKSPVVTDGGQTQAESGAILEYLIERYGNGRLRPPAGSPERLRYTYWLHYAEGSAMPPLLLKLVFTRLPRPVPALIRPIVRAVARRAQESFIDPQLRTHIDFWEHELQKSTWFAGEELTGADIQMSFPLEAAAARAGIALGPRVSGFSSASTRGPPTGGRSRQAASSAWRASSSSGTPGTDRRHSRPAAVLKPCRARPAAFKKGSP